jgi:hypothetical protein
LLSDHPGSVAPLGNAREQGSSGTDSAVSLRQEDAFAPSFRRAPLSDVPYPIVARRPVDEVDGARQMAASAEICVPIGALLRRGITLQVMAQLFKCSRVRHGRPSTEAFDVAGYTMYRS